MSFWKSGRRHRIAHASLSSLLLLAGHAASGMLATPAAAQETTRRFDIPAQPLGEALVQFGLQSGLQVVADGSLTAGRQSAGVSGTHSPAEALSRLLAGTGLTFRFTTSTTVLLEALPADTGDAVRLGAVRVGASAGGGAIDARMDPVRTEGSKSYAPTAVIVGKTPLTLREIPQSVTVITAQRLADQALLNLDDVLLQMTGVTRDQAWLSSSYNSRGLPIENVRYDGGATSTYLAGTGNADTALFDSVALLRGADGMFGAVEAGGILNLNHKRPLAEPAFNVTLQGGSWKTLRGEVDATGSLGFDGRLRGRLVGVIEDKDSFVDYANSKRHVAYGAIEADLTPDTLLFIGGSYQFDRLNAFNHSLSRYADGSDPNYPRSQNMGTPWNWIKRNNSAVFARLDQRLGGDWAIKLNLRYNHNRDRTNAAEMENAVNPVTMTGTDWWYFQKEERNKQFTADLNTSGSFELFGRRHDVLVGIDMVNTNTSYDQLWTYYGPETDVTNPTFPPEIDLPSAWGYQDRTKIRRTGVYGSLRLRPIENLAVLLGGRLVLKDRTISRDINGVLTSEVKEGTVFVPNFGFTYDFTRNLTLYGSYAEIYQSQANLRSGPRPGTPLAPVTGSNYELGIKGAFADGRLTASAAIYRVVKKGASANDPSYPDTVWNSPCCYIRDGYQKSQGFDIEVNGEILPGWQLSLGYTFNNNKDIRESDARFSSITPKHLLKIWTDYRFSGSLEGLRIGGGVNGQSKNFRMGSIQQYNPVSGQWDGPWVDYRFSVKGYTVWAARIGYDFNEKMSIGLNVNNIFDKKYYDTISSAGYGNFYGDPRNVLVTLKAGF